MTGFFHKTLTNEFYYFEQNQGGLKGRVESTGYGVYYTLNYMLEDEEFCGKAGVSTGLKGKTFIIEVFINFPNSLDLILKQKGFGNAGYWAAHYLQEAGGILVGVLEHDGQIYNPDGNLNNKEYLRKYLNF